MRFLTLFWVAVKSSWADKHTFDLGRFNLSSPLGQSLGGLLAGVILFASWRWIYRIVAISMALQAPGLYWCLSRVGKVERIEGMAGRWWRMLDVVGGGFLVCEFPLSSVFLGS